MSGGTVTRMDAIEIASFLQDNDTGVLSLADGDDAYGIPVNYAFEEAEPAIYVRLGYASGSQKRAYVEAVDHASFLVYDGIDEGWKSVVARGRLTTLSESTLDTRVREAIEGLAIPYFAVFDRPEEDLEFNVVRLDATEIDGVIAET